MANDHRNVIVGRWDNINYKCNCVSNRVKQGDGVSPCHFSMYMTKLTDIFLQYNVLHCIIVLYYEALY